ncbi:hypothetical protein FGO68_gene7415 [Halteria grandinella]|uniref:Uncharacterized protein n=1 Tax=Halteria grandinella TaxID=5974 RepID=A0A8J8NV61_HALGN|nr:hypothetical protein FGO68_gene7415 [Halteria grandinella]
MSLPFGVPSFSIILINLSAVVFNLAITAQSTAEQFAKKFFFKLYIIANPTFAISLLTFNNSSQILSCESPFPIKSKFFSVLAIPYNC